MEERRNLTNSQGGSLPVGMNHGFNEISEIVTRIAGMLIQDAMGFNVHINPRSGGERALYYLAGCDQPQSRTGCNGGPNQYHIALIPISEKNWDTKTVFKSKKPEKVGTGIGYEATATLHMTEEVAQHALQEEGLSLQYYSNWNASWWDVSKYFDNFTSIPTSQLLRCDEVWLGDPTFMATYVRITGDRDGLHPNGTGICPDGHWFLSPACRANPSKCVPATGLWITVPLILFLKGTIMKYKFILFSPWVLKSPGYVARIFLGRRHAADSPEKRCFRHAPRHSQSAP